MKNLTMARAVELEEQSYGRSIKPHGFQTQEIDNHQLAWLVYSVDHRNDDLNWTEIRWTVFVDGRASTGGSV